MNGYRYLYKVVLEWHNMHRMIWILIHPKIWIFYRKRAFIDCFSSPRQGKQRQPPSLGAGKDDGQFRSPLPCADWCQCCCILASIVCHALSSFWILFLWVERAFSYKIWWKFASFRSRTSEGGEGMLYSRTGRWWGKETGLIESVRSNDDGGD